MSIWPFKKRVGPRTLRELIVEYQAGRDFAYSTSRKHFHDHDRLAEYLGRVPLVADLNDESVSLYFRSRLLEGRAVRTANSGINVLRTFWFYAHKKGYLETEPGERPVAIPDARSNAPLGAVLDEDVAATDFL